MTWLGAILAVKIVVTALASAIPFLILPPARLATLAGTDIQAKPLVRLYGVAITALLVGYASGFWAIAEGVFPWGVVAMGIVSNGGATLTIVLTGVWQRILPMVLFLGGITLALIAAAALPGWALSRIV